MIFEILRKRQINFFLAFMCSLVFILSCRSLSVAEESAPDLGLMNSSIIGQWKFIAYIYHNQQNPPLNPQLDLYFTFSVDGTDELQWSREDQPGFCDRKGHYLVQKSGASLVLQDHVDWINPQNAMDCASDPDMQVGKDSLNPVQVNDKGQLLLDIGLSGESFIYVFERKK